MNSPLSTVWKVAFIVVLLVAFSLLLTCISVMLHYLSPIYEQSYKYYSEMGGSSIPNPFTSGLPVLRSMAPPLIVVSVILIIIGVLIYKKRM